MMLKTSLLALSVGVGFSAGWAEGAFLTYVPQSGSTVEFTSITESSIEPTTQVPLDGLYNQPSASGDALVFTNLNFRAQSTGPRRDFDYVDFVDGQLNVTIQSKADHYITELTFSEFGDYTLQQSLLVPNAAAVQITVPIIFVQVLERAGNPITPVGVNGTIDWGVGGNSFNITAMDPSETGVFAGSEFMDLVALTGFSDITKIAFSINNQLYAESLPNASAAIAKKGVTIEIGSAAVPEPASLAFLAALAGGLLARRRHA